MNPFEANAFPLDPGIRLLEASAGTGKTFALAHLVLRLVAERGWALREVLVVTFTEAAVAELRDRIARRLQQALTLLEASTPTAALDPGAGFDPTLIRWLAGWSAAHPPQQTALLRGRLLLALEDLDASDITTIHGFCARTLQRQALEAGRPAELRVESQNDGLVDQVVHDYWQQQLLALPVALLAGLQAARLTPELLVSLLASLDGDPALALDPLPPELPVDEPLSQALPSMISARWRIFLDRWQAQGAALEAEFCAAAASWKQAAATGGKVSTTPYAARPRKNRVAELDAWIAEQPADGCYEAVRAQDLLSSYFHPAPFAKLARRHEVDQRAGERLPQESLLRVIAALVDGPAEAVLLHACHWGRAELARRRERRGVISFSGLLEQLDPGLDGAIPSPLLEAVGQRYRAVLVDEFQDTDPIQWRILRCAFGQGQHALVLVGDPKQAIYRFRGGDLATYRRAGQAAGDRFDLLENRRSTEALVQASNVLMASGLRRSDLPVPPVQARASRSGPEGPPIDLLWLGPEDPAAAALPSRSELEARLPDWIAAYLVQMLGEGLRLVGPEGERPLEPQDCCLLVSSHRQAEQLRQALERLGLASRLVSRADVFATPGATALQRFLDALADPGDLNRLRLLAASPLQGWSAATIAGTGSAGWSALAGRLEALARQLHRRGLLGLLGEWLAADTLASLAWGGRLLADLQQVAELVQERIHAEQLDAAAAADWLRRLRLAEERLVPEEHQAHSDRRDGAVAVVTIHRSKGLEFPVVICPYLWQSAGGPGRGPVRIGRRWQPAAADRPHLDLHLSTAWGQGRRAELQNRLAEEEERERLAYVAITRACHRLVLAWGPAAGQQAAPLLPWLFAGLPLADLEDDHLAALPPARWRERLAEEIRARDLPIRLLDPPPAGVGPRPRPAAGAEPLATGPVPSRSLDSRWGRSSYSSWTHSSHAPLDPLALDLGRDTADPALPQDIASGSTAEPALPQPIASVAAAAVVPPDAPWLVTSSRGAEPGSSDLSWPEQGPLGAFPRGATAGDCLHRILERVELSDSLLLGEAPVLVQRELRRAGFDQEPIEPLLEGLEQMRTTPFGAALGGLRVADLAPGRRLHEMAFDLTLADVRAADLAAAFAAHPGGLFGAEYAASLARLPIDSRGFLTGSIDLVFRADATPSGGDGRWWVLDWKSNWLGRRDGDGRPLACGPRHYDQASMAQLMAASHYPLQAHLYLVALHRYLVWRLPGYAPERDLGGYAYVFVRGTPGPLGLASRPERVPGMVVERPPLGRILALDRALAGGGFPAAGLDPALLAAPYESDRPVAGTHPAEPADSAAPFASTAPLSAGVPSATPEAAAFSDPSAVADPLPASRLPSDPRPIDPLSTDRPSRSRGGSRRGRQPGGGR
jgi:exodeoxyribonuclease V beta subunit